MGQRILAAVPKLYAQALSVRPWAPRGGNSDPARAQPVLPAPAELGNEVTFELALLDRMPVGLGIYDANGWLVHGNPCFDRLIGSRRLPARSEPGTRWTGYRADGGMLPTRDFPCERAMRGETVSPGIDLLYDKGDGESRWLNVSAAPILDPVNETIVGLVLLYFDTHERVQANSFAAEAARRFEQFAEQSSTAIWIADVTGERFSYRNPRHLALAGGTLSEIGGIGEWLERIDEGDRAEVRGRYALVQSGRTERLHYRIHGLIGGSHQIDETCFPIFNDAGQIVSIGGLATEAADDRGTILYLVGNVSSAGSPLHGLAQARSGRAKSFASLEQLIDVAEFLAPGCVVIDLAESPDVAGGLERALAAIAGAMPVVVLGRADTSVATAVEAMRLGAANYLMPPLSAEALAEAIRQASLSHAASAAPASARVVPVEDDRLARLSTREREVLAGLAGGGTNKSIARDLAISPRTVELYRARLMERMNAGSLAELLRKARDIGG
jgi:FixJ family two-component response regulator/PAS domain-containing protein